MQTTESLKLDAFVISVGVINPAVGKTTAFGNDNYDFYEAFGEGGEAYLVNGSLLFGAKGSLKVDDMVQLRANDSQRKSGYPNRVEDVAPVVKEELMAMLKRNKYDYTPLRAFRARPEGNRKLSTCYSIKGTQLSNVKN